MGRRTKRRAGSYIALLFTGIVFAVVGVVLAIIGGVAAGMSIAAGTGGDYIIAAMGVGTFIGGLMVIAVGEALLALRDIARHTARIE